MSGSVGFNAKLSELGAATGLAALDALEATVEARRRHGAAIRAATEGRGVRFQRGAERSPWGATNVVLESRRHRDAAVERAAELDVEIRTLWDPPLHLHPAWPGRLAASGHGGRRRAVAVAADGS